MTAVLRRCAVLTAKYVSKAEISVQHGQLGYSRLHLTASRSYHLETVVERSCQSIGEGPHWDERTRQLLYVDIMEGFVHRWSADTRIDEKHKFDNYCSLVIPCASGGYIVSINKTLYHFDWDTKRTVHIATVDEGLHTRLNDGKCDSSGRLWFGTMGLEKSPAVVNENEGSLYSLELNGTVRRHKGGVSISNGLAWTKDNHTMFYIDSLARAVWAYDFDVLSGTIENERVAVDFGGKETLDTYGYPDGMAIDTDDKLWVACYNTGRVVQFDPKTGKELNSISIPAKRTTSCCFGGDKFDEMYITCSRFGVPEAELQQYPLSGSLFRATGLGIRGFPAPVYKGFLINQE